MKPVTYEVTSVARTSSPRMCARFHHSIWTGDSMIVIGGDVKNGVSKTAVGGIYFPHTNIWRDQ